jgi:hypothetical protein
VVAGVEGRLSAADLTAGKLDVEAGLTEQRLGIGDRVREDEIADARGEELDPATQDAAR